MLGNRTPKDIHTHTTPPHGATRLDRFYITSEMRRRKMGIKIIPAAFTDHYAVALRITVQDTDLQRA